MLALLSQVKPRDSSLNASLGEGLKFTAWPAGAAFAEASTVGNGKRLGRCKLGTVRRSQARFLSAYG